MKIVWMLLAASLAWGQAPRNQLDDVARVASVMLDGDVAGRIVTDRAWKEMVRRDPKDPWAGSDNYDVNPEPFIQTKKTLARLARLVAFPCDVNLWMPVKGSPDKVHVVIRNANEISQFWPWGTLYQDMPSEMKRVLEKGERVTVATKPGFVSVLAPVYDSLGDIVGIAEVAARERPDAQENVK